MEPSDIHIALTACKTKLPSELYTSMLGKKHETIVYNNSLLQISELPTEEELYTYLSEPHGSYTTVHRSHNKRPDDKKKERKLHVKTTSLETKNASILKSKRSIDHLLLTTEEHFTQDWNYSPPYVTEAFAVSFDASHNQSYYTIGISDQFLMIKKGRFFNLSTNNLSLSHGTLLLPHLITTTAIHPVANLSVACTSKKIYLYSLYYNETKNKTEFIEHIKSNVPEKLKKICFISKGTLLALSYSGNMYTGAVSNQNIDWSKKIIKDRNDKVLTVNNFALNDYRLIFNTNNTELYYIDFKQKDRFYFCKIATDIDGVQLWLDNNIISYQSKIGRLRIKNGNGELKKLDIRMIPLKTQEAYKSL